MEESFKFFIVVIKMNTELWGTAEPSGRELWHLTPHILIYCVVTFIVEHSNAALVIT